MGRIEAGIEKSSTTVRSLLAYKDEIAAICDRIIRALKDGRKVLTAGNGGSAAEALHMSEELIGRFRENRRSLPAVCLAADSTALTCIGNDYGFDRIFSRQVDGLGAEGDVLVLFSTSGKAPNLKLALESASTIGMKIVCLLGRDGGVLVGQGDNEIVVSNNATERIQEAHQVLIHLILDEIEHAFN